MVVLSPAMLFPLLSLVWVPVVSNPMLLLWLLSNTKPDHLTSRPWRVVNVSLSVLKLPTKRSSCTFIGYVTRCSVLYLCCFADIKHNRVSTLVHCQPSLPLNLKRTLAFGQLSFFPRLYSSPPSLSCWLVARDTCWLLHVVPSLSNLPSLSGTTLRLTAGSLSLTSLMLVSHPISLLPIPIGLPKLPGMMSLLMSSSVLYVLALSFAGIPFSGSAMCKSPTTLSPWLLLWTLATSPTTLW